MVRAVLYGRKTQTRRVIQHTECVTHVDRLEDGWRFTHSDGQGGNQSVDRFCPYGQSGDQLWVRETFLRLFDDGDGGLTCLMPTSEKCQLASEAWKYRATDRMPENFGATWKPSTHMPRRASRITLEVTDVRVERLQSISPDDAQAEGCDDAWLVKEKATVGLIRGCVPRSLGFNKRRSWPWLGN